MGWVHEVVRFWFDELAPKNWWRGSPEVDRHIRERFGALRETLVRAPPEAAALDAVGHLAVVIVLDQFSRHLFRGSAEAFASDALALAMSVDAIDRGVDRTLDDRQRQFLYMPLMHSEDPAVQQRSLAMFATLRIADALESARDHHATIARFGRFPARNAALGRASTDAERAFLESKARSARRRKR